MASVRVMLCDICNGRQISTNAEHWCSECQESFCTECLSHHSISKLSKHHQVISIDEYRKIPYSVSQVTSQCEEHDRHYQNYCSKHESLCCPVCISSIHKDCTGLLAIEEVVKTSKSSVVLGRMQDSLASMRNNIDMITKDRKQNLTAIMLQSKQFTNDIKELRTKINSCLDKLEKQILEDILFKEEEIRAKFEDFLKELVAKSDRIEKLQRNLDAVKNYASDIQTFLGSRKIEVEIQQEEKLLKSLTEDERLQTITLNCKIDKNIGNILTTKQFASVVIETGPPTSKIKPELEKQAQIMSTTLPKSFCDIKLTKHSTITLPKSKPGSSFSGCDISPSGKMIVSDYKNNRLILLNSNGTFEKEIPSESPTDVSFVDDSNIVLSSWSSGTEIMNLHTLDTKHVSKTHVSNCFGVTHHQGTFIWCEYRRGIQMKKLTQKKIININSLDGKHHWQYCTSYGVKIYITHMHQDKVTCYKTTGEKVWEFKDISILKTPRGITVDNVCNVYVASEGTRSIVVISSDGKSGRQLIGQEDGSFSPWGLSFDKIRNRLMVSDKNKCRVFFYSV